MTRLRLFATCIATALLAIALAPAVPTAAATSGATATATVRINPLSIELDLPPRTPTAGQQIRARATIRNLGDTPVTDLIATLHVSESNITITDGVDRDLGTFDGGDRTQTAWQLCTEQPGTYLVLVRAEGTLDGAPIVAHSPARQLTITAPPGRRPSTCR
jgi:hypothetical protein